MSRFARAAQRALAPRLRNAMWEYREVLKDFVDANVRWLDIGCGHQLMPSWMPDGDTASADLSSRCHSLVGIDRVRASLARHATLRHRVEADVSELPFRQGTFDLVTANMVVEHLDDPDAQLAEVARVLVPGGTFLFHTPNARSYQVLPIAAVPAQLRRRAAAAIEGRELDDVFLTRYRMNSRPAVEALASRNGFEVERLIFLNSTPMTWRLGPFLIPELLLIRLLEQPALAQFRPNMIVALRKRLVPKAPDQPR